MWKWLEGLFGRKPKKEAMIDERILVLEREVQGLRLELQEREQTLANLKKELEHQRIRENARVNEAVQTQMERLFSDIATPIAQLLTQAHLYEVEGKPIQPKDVFTVVKSLVRLLEDEGLTIEGKVGEKVSFDPNQHEPLSAQISLKPEETVVVRIVGISYRGRVLKKVGVTKL